MQNLCLRSEHDLRRSRWSKLLTILLLASSLTPFVCTSTSAHYQARKNARANDAQRARRSPFFIHDAPNPDANQNPNHNHRRNNNGDDDDGRRATLGDGASSHHNPDGTHRDADPDRRRRPWRHGWPGWRPDWDRRWTCGTRDSWVDYVPRRVPNMQIQNYGDQAQQPATDLPNFGKVENWLYRGAQPTEDGLEQLYQKGVRFIVDLRTDEQQIESEQQLCRYHDLHFVSIPIGERNAPTQQDVNLFMDVVETARQSQGDGAVFVHGRAGADRTGTLVAIYRELRDKYTFDQAYKEMLQFGFDESKNAMKDFVASMAKQDSSPVAKDHPAVHIPKAKSVHSLPAKTPVAAREVPVKKPENTALSQTELRKDEAVLNPAKTWLYCVGILTYADGRANATFGKRNRRDTQLVSLVREMGVPENHTVYIKDWKGTIQNIKASFPPMLQQTQPGDFLIDYYTGHGGDGSFETCNGGSYEMNWIQNQIQENFKGSQVLLLGDACESGSLEDIVDHSTGSIGYACISSSSRKECGNGNWTMSQAVLDGLRGEPCVDINNDGYITVDELAAHVHHDILAYENNHSVYKKNANFNGNMIVARTKPRTGPDPKPVMVWYENKWWRAKEVERDGGQARVRWIELGYDSPDQDRWIGVQNVRPIQIVQ